MIRSEEPRQTLCFQAIRTVLDVAGKIITSDQKTPLFSGTFAIGKPPLDRKSPF
ncbi:hypothetical protein [Roseobacter sp. OBYS 0001]|uniref:hypothetical protein n=1 Tax=Roseobacter sp. OBYS 0001 TaxID=882651 RepID=UPI001C7F31F7|nr:hypothetical protein [Roseobacter sp. OBYS 0001]